MRVERRQFFADMLSGLIEHMRERDDTTQLFVSAYVADAEDDLLSWYGEDGRAALQMIAEEDRAHSVVEYDDALGVLRGDRDAYRARLTLCERGAEAFRAQAEKTVAAYGLVRAAEDYVCHSRGGKRTHGLLLTVRPEYSDGEMILCVGASDTVGQTAKDGSIDMARVARREEMVCQEAGLDEDGFLSPEDARRLTAFVDFAARRALMRKVSREEKKRYIRHAPEETRGLLLLSAGTGLLWALGMSLFYGWIIIVPAWILMTAVLFLVMFCFARR